MPDYGRLVVFEGPDAVGKSSVVDECAARLAAVGIDAVQASFPGKEPNSAGQLVYQLHHSPSDLGVRGVSATGLQMFHIAAHVDAIESTLLPALRDGRWVLLDRYWWSTLVYGRVLGADMEVLQKAVEAEKVAWAGAAPEVFCFVRSAPLRPEDERTWRETGEAYRQLASAEGNRYPVHMIVDAVSVKAAADQSLAVLLGNARA